MYSVIMLHSTLPSHQVSSCASAQDAIDRLPPHLAQAVWPGHVLGTGAQLVWPSGHPQLDAELPGGGWPAHCLSAVSYTHLTLPTSDLV